MTNLGTAYVSVMPSMKGFGAAVENGMSGVDTTRAGAAMGRKAATGFAGGLAKSGVIIGAASAIASRGLDMVASSAGRAISRVDTMANFPKVMTNLGYSADDAASSIKTMSDRLDGLPTSLDGMTAFVQQLAPMTGSLSKATDVGLAFNNMMLAGGASTMEQASAMTQFSQALAKGKPDMQDWRALQQVMPGQLDQVAKAMLGAEANSVALYEALKSGNVSMNDFMDTVLRLNTEGVDGFASFEQQAKDASTGIQTAIDNLNTRVAKGVATLIDTVGQENISGAINYVSSGIGDIANDLAGDLKIATEFVVEHKEELASLVDTLTDFAPTAIRAWGALQLFKGGKALLGGIIGGAEALAGKMAGFGEKAFYMGAKMEEAGFKGGEALMEFGGILSTITPGAAALTTSVLAIGAANIVYTHSAMEAAAATVAFNAEQQATVDHARELSASYGELATQRETNIGKINAESRNIQFLYDQYNGLIDANGQIIAGNEERADSLLGNIADALGIEKESVYGLIDAYGKLGDAAQDALEKRRGQNILDADQGSYENALNTRDDAMKSLADTTALLSEAEKDLTASTETYNASQQTQLDILGATPEALGYVNSEQIVLAGQLTQNAKDYESASDAFKKASDTYTQCLSTIQNHEGLRAALESGDVEAVHTWSTRVQEGFLTAETGTRESLERQVQTIGSNLQNMRTAMENGQPIRQEDIDSMSALLTQAETELTRFDSVQLSSKFASVTVEDGTLRDANGRVYEWNGTALVDKESGATVNDAELVDAQGRVWVWNGTSLENKHGEVTTSVDTSAWDSWDPPTKTAYVRTFVSSFFGGNAAGGFIDMHASGGFIADRPMSIGTDRKGVNHIVGEAGAEWVMAHADGTASVVPIENRKYMKPYAATIAPMVASLIGSGRNAQSITFVVNGATNPEQFARQTMRKVGQIQRAR